MVINRDTAIGHASFTIDIKEKITYRYIKSIFVYMCLSEKRDVDLHERLRVIIIMIIWSVRQSIDGLALCLNSHSILRFQS